MNRRKALKMAGVSGASAAFPKQLIAGTVIDECIEQWNISKKFTLDMMKAMPVEYFDFQATPEQMAYGKQFTHLCYFNTLLIGLIKGKKAIPEPESSDFETTQRYVVETFDFCTGILSEMADKDFDLTDNENRPGWLKDKTNRELVHRAVIHTSHHRGQAVVYLRLKGIKPPKFSV